MNTFILLRDQNISTFQTTGQLFVLDENANELFSCFTLELPWKENQTNISCIPEGTYPIEHRWSKKFGNHIHILDVPDRTLILIHEANFVHELRGCIAVGRQRMDLNGDGLKDLTQSVKTKNDLTKFVQSNAQLIISTNKERNGNPRTH